MSAPQPRGFLRDNALSLVFGVQLRLVVPGQPAAAIGGGKEVADAR